MPSLTFRDWRQLWIAKKENNWVALIAPKQTGLYLSVKRREYLRLYQMMNPEEERWRRMQGGSNSAASNLSDTIRPTRTLTRSGSVTCNKITSYLISTATQCIRRSLCQSCPGPCVPAPNSILLWCCGTVTVICSDLKSFRSVWRGPAPHTLSHLVDPVLLRSAGSAGNASWEPNPLLIDGAINTPVHCCNLCSRHL